MLFTSRPFSFNRLAFRFFFFLLNLCKKISFTIYIVMNIKDLPKQYYNYILQVIKLKCLVA